MSGCALATVFSFIILESRPGFVVLQVTGPKAAQLFQHEGGGHRVQRIPPTEKRGRMQTSTITVAILPEPTEVQIQIKPPELEWATCRGSGAGGQHRNVTDSAVQLRHLPSGIMVRCEGERSQAQNKASALTALRARLWEREQGAATGARAADRKAQVGCGARGDKIRTIRTQDDQVTDHRSGRTWSWKRYQRGDWD